MSTTNLPFMRQLITQYGMTIYLGLGIVGNMINCIIFTRHCHRRTPSSIYLLFLSIFGIIYLVWTIAPVLHTLNNTDLQTTSIVYCKMRQYISQFLATYLRYIIVFACADRFFVTQATVRIRSLSSVKTAIKLLCIMCIICPLIALPMPILMDIRNSVCNMFGTYKLVHAIYQTVVVGIVPPVLMCVFSILTIHNLHRRHLPTQMRGKRRDLHLTRMVIAEMLVNVCTSIPFSANLLYGAATYYVPNRSVEQQQIDSFLTFLSQFLIYLLAVAPFYLFILISKPFRHECLSLFMNFWNNTIKRRMRVVPVTQQNLSVINTGRK